MLYDIRQDIWSDVEERCKICVLPVPRLLLHERVLGLEGCYLYPAGAADSHALRIVSHPEWELSEAQRKGYGQLAWVQSGATRISYTDYEDITLIAFPFELNFDQFFDDSHDEHKALLQRAVERAETAMDLVRLNYCRFDLPNTLPGRSGTLAEGPYTTALFYNPDDHESYIIGGEIVTHKISIGLGLELDDYSGEKYIGSGEVGGIVRTALSLMTAAMEANSLTTKFVQCMTLLEFLASPYSYQRMKNVKTDIALHVARDKASYLSICEHFKSLSSSKNEAGEESGLRTNIVHYGRKLEALVPSYNAQRELFRTLQRYIHCVMADFLKLSDEPWSMIEELRSRKRRELGI